MAQSGWQYEGLWNGFTGTAIGPHQFITATHVGGQVGALFEMAGKKYPATGWTPIPNSDMTIWWVEGTLPIYAQLYEKSGEVGQEIMMFGRGTQRGTAVRLDGQIRGWRWGNNDNRLSWGKNQVAGFSNFGAPSVGEGSDPNGLGDALLSSGGSPTPSLGPMLVWGFLDTGDPNTGSISGGDSGGSVFIKDGETWKLAGVIHGTDTGYRRTLSPGASGAPFRASIFDARGLYRASDNGLVGGLFDEDPLNRCSLGFACRISAHANEIHRALKLPPRSRLTRRFIALVVFGPLLFIAALWFAGVMVARAVARRRATVRIGN